MNKTINTLIGNPSILKKVNRVRVMNYLNNHGPTSRAQLARETGLDGKTITNICNNLLSDSLIMAPKTVQNGQRLRGRPPEVLSLNNDAAYAIGVDFGAQQVTGLVIDFGSNVKTRIRREYESPESKDFLLKEIDAVITELLDTIDSKARKKIKAIGLCVPGLIDKSAGIVVQSVNIQDFNEVPIVEIIQKKFSFDVILEDSSRAMALAEMWFGEITRNNFLCIDLGYGIGMGIIENGLLYQGANGRSGEIGHTIVQPGGYKCRCGREGCLETVASGRALAEMASEAGVIELSPEKISAKAVYESAKDGNTEAQDLLKQAGKYIGIAIANVIDLFDPQAVVLNGGLINAGEMLVGPLKEVVEQHNINFSDLSYDIEESKIGADASALGAAMMPLRSCFEFENIKL